MAVLMECAQILKNIPTDGLDQAWSCNNERSNLFTKMTHQPDSLPTMNLNFLEVPHEVIHNFVEPTMGMNNHAHPALS
jgi:hypothetical protein